MRPPRCHVYGTIEISIANKPSAAKTSLSKLGKCWIFFAVIFTYFYLHLLNSVDSNALTARRAWAWILLGCFCVEVACSARILWCPPTVQLGDSKVSVDVNGSGSILPRIHQNLGIWWVNFQRPRNQFIAAVATFPFMVWNVGCAAWKHQKKKKKVFHSFFSWGVFVRGAFMGQPGWQFKVTEPVTLFENTIPSYCDKTKPKIVPPCSPFFIHHAFLVFLHLLLCYTPKTPKQRFK